MTISQKTLQNYLDQNKDLIVQQFKDSKNLLLLIDSYSNQISEYENMVFDLLNKRINIDKSEGKQLDNIGSLIGVDREGATDSDFRILLKSTIGINGSSGTIESILSFIKSLTGSNSEVLENSFPAFFEINVQDEISFNPLRLFTLLLLAKPAGVGMLLKASPIDPFTMVDGSALGGLSGPIDSSRGFGDFFDSGATGGKFSSIIGI